MHCTVVVSYVSVLYTRWDPKIPLTDVYVYSTFVQISSGTLVDIDSLLLATGFPGLRPADGVFCAVLVPSVDTTVLVFDLPVSVKKRFIRFC